LMLARARPRRRTCARVKSSVTVEDSSPGGRGGFPAGQASGRSGHEIGFVTRLGSCGSGHTPSVSGGVSACLQRAFVHPSRRPDRRDRPGHPPPAATRRRRADTSRCGGGPWCAPRPSRNHRTADIAPDAAPVAGAGRSAPEQHPGPHDWKRTSSTSTTPPAVNAPKTATSSSRQPRSMRHPALLDCSSPATKLRRLIG
jgi:hypothetical protein